MAFIARKIGKGLPVPFTMGLIAGALAALICMLLPMALIEDIVVASGLPAILPAAAPPLGLTARALLAIIGGALALVTTCGALVLADHVTLRRRKPKSRHEHERVEAVAEPVYQQRRRVLAMLDEEEDLRRPIFAVSDLGVPVAEVATDLEEQEEAETPIEYAAPFEYAPITLTSEPEAEIEPEPASEFQPLYESSIEAEFEPVAEEQIELLDLEPIAAAMWSERRPPADEPDAEIEDEWADEPEFEAFAPAIEASAAEPVEDFATVQPVHAERVRPVVDYDSLTLADLVSRLEEGLERRRQRGASALSAVAPEPRPVVMSAVPDRPSDMDTALRDALWALQRMTGRSR